MRAKAPQFLGSKPAILGNGLSGRAAQALLKAYKLKSRIYDEASGDIFAPEKHDWVIVSPGFFPTHPWIKKTQSLGIPLCSELDTAALCCTNPIVAITGTNGKTTLTHLLTQALRQAGIPAEPAGNSHAPLSAKVLQTPKNCTLVCEVSSFQLQLPLKHFRASSLLYTNFAADHLDYHGSPEAYFNAKYQLIERLENPRACFCTAELQDQCKAFGKPPAPIHGARPAGLGFPAPEQGKPASQTKDARPAPSAAPQGSLFAKEPWSALYELAAAYFKHHQLELSCLEKAAQNAKTLPHRFEFIAEVQNTRFIDDSKATNFHAAAAAVKNAKKPIYWIGGGNPKGNQPKTLARQIAPKLAAGFSIGPCAEILAEELRNCGVKAERCPNLEAATARAFLLSQQNLKKGDSPATVLLSPGMASPPEFVHFVQRGQCFQAAVAHLQKNQKKSFKV